MPQSDDEVKVLLEKFGLMGVWRVDCSKAPAKPIDQAVFEITAGGKNVIHLGSSDHFQGTTVITSAQISSPTEIVMSLANAFSFSEQGFEMTLKKELGKLRVWRSVTLKTGEVVVKDGLSVAAQTPIPTWEKCP